MNPNHPGEKKTTGSQAAIRSKKQTWTLEAIKSNCSKIWCRPSSAATPQTPSAPSRNQGNVLLVTPCGGLITGKRARSVRAITVAFNLCSMNADIPVTACPHVCC